jgi:8-oxo-dGTP pyrophosphatase MutT (NUDIX family)
MGGLPLFLISAGVNLERDGRILVLKRAVGALVGFWGIPSGLMEHGETPEQAARRELFEEAGLAAGSLTLVGVTTMEIYGHHCIRLLYTGAAAAGEVRLSHEHSDAVWIDPHEYRHTHLGDASIATWRARNAADGAVLEAVRTTFDEYLAWRDGERP